MSNFAAKNCLTTQNQINFILMKRDIFEERNYKHNQKRLVLLLFIAGCLFACTNPDISLDTNNGALSGEFSTSDSTKVHFSTGNLQYQPYSGKWRFAANQYDIVGEGNTTSPSPRKPSQRNSIFESPLPK